MTPKKKPFETIMGKGQNDCKQIFSFSKNVFYPFQHKFQFLVTNILSSTNAFNLSKILSFGQGISYMWLSLRRLNIPNQNCKPTKKEIPTYSHFQPSSSNPCFYKPEEVVF